MLHPSPHLHRLTRDRWLHHTSFLWDFDDSLLGRYLLLPEKRPEYRQDRSHKDFLVRLSPYQVRPHSLSQARTRPTPMASDTDNNGEGKRGWNTINYSIAAGRIVSGH